MNSIIHKGIEKLDKEHHEKIENEEILATKENFKSLLNSYIRNYLFLTMLPDFLEYQDVKLEKLSFFAREFIQMIEIDEPFDTDISEDVNLKDINFEIKERSKVIKLKGSIIDSPAISAYEGRTSNKLQLLSSVIEKFNHRYSLNEEMSNSLRRSWENTVAEPEMKNLILEPSNLIPDIITQISKKVMEYIYKEDKPLFQKLTIEDGTKNEIIKDLIKHEKETSQR